MTGGFRYVAGGVVLIVAAFAAISSWSLVLSNRAPVAQAVQNPPSTQPASTLSPSSAPPQSMTRPQPLPEYTFTEDQESVPQRPGWLYTQESAILRIKPGGRGFPPPSLNNAPLTLVKGTRVWPRETAGDWVMIKSPGGRLGWVLATELDKSRPYIPPRG